MTADLGFAIAGAGTVGRFHADAIAQTPGAHLVAVCRSGPSGRTATAEAFGVPCADDFDALVARPDVDVVCICTPNGFHARQIVAAAKAGKHVLVEKPMALTLRDADDAVSACRAASVRLGVVFQRRTEPVYRALHAAVSAGDLGRLVMGHVAVPYLRTPAYYQSAAWRGTWAVDGGGALMNQGIHLVDLLVWLMGDVEEVQASSTTALHAIEVEDCVVASLRFKSGALGTLTATTAAAPGFPHRVEIYGSEGGAQIEGESVVRWEGKVPRRAPEAAPATAGAGGSPTAIGVAGHARIMADFVEAVRTGRAPLVSGEEGRRSLALVLAVYQSARLGRPVALVD